MSLSLSLPCLYTQGKKATDWGQHKESRTVTSKAEQKIKERSHQLSLYTVLVGTQADRLKSSVAGEVKLFMLLEKKAVIIQWINNLGCWTSKTSSYRPQRLFQKSSLIGWNREVKVWLPSPGCMLMCVKSMLRDFVEPLPEPFRSSLQI